MAGLLAAVANTLGGCLLRAVTGDVTSLRKKLVVDHEIEHAKDVTSPQL